MEKLKLKEFLKLAKEDFGGEKFLFENIQDTNEFEEFFKNTDNFHNIDEMLIRFFDEINDYERREFVIENISDEEVLYLYKKVHENAVGDARRAICNCDRQDILDLEVDLLTIDLEENDASEYSDMIPAICNHKDMNFDYALDFISNLDFAYHNSTRRSDLLDLLNYFKEAYAEKNERFTKYINNEEVYITVDSVLKYNNASYGYGKAYVAKLIDLDPKFGFKRKFLNRQTEYTNSSKTNWRSYYWTFGTVDGEVFEKREANNYKNHNEFFVIKNGKVEIISQEEAEALLS